MTHPFAHLGIEDLAGRKVLITGGARRIGRVLAAEFARAGAHVAVTYRGSAADARETVEELRALVGVGVSVQCDVAQEKSVQSAVDEASAALGGLDMLINNAGAFETASLEAITVEQWDAMFSTNTRGPFLVSKAAYPLLKASRGRILNVGSLGGMHPWATHAHYCTSKAAVHMLSQTMAKAWAPEISVNCIAPGMIVMDGGPSAGYSSFAEKTPMKRNGSPRDVAAAALFFATAPHFITGQLLAVDGGLGL